MAFAYAEKAGAAFPPGFGFLVPRSEGKRILACTLVHQKFRYRAPAGSSLVRCFLGGTRDEPIMDASDSEIESIVRSELQEILGLTAPAEFARIYRWPKSMAQYTVGHK